MTGIRRLGTGSCVRSATGLSLLAQLPALRSWDLSALHCVDDIDLSPLRLASGLTWLNLGHFRYEYISEVRPKMHQLVMCVRL